MSEKGLKRINFFKGFFTDAKDWQDAQHYHMEKRKLHNRSLYTPGIVYGLEVAANREGNALTISRGYAIDGDGQDIVLSEPEKIGLPNSRRSNTTWYVTIQYAEKEEDWRENAENQEYSGYAFIREYPEISMSSDKPDNHHTIELARIELARSTVKIKNAKDPFDPKTGEIDSRYVNKVRATKGQASLHDFMKVVKPDSQIPVPAGKDNNLTPSDEDANTLIETLRKDAPPPTYFVSAYPMKEGRITWVVVSKFNQNNVEYRLYFKNLSDNANNVRYKIYKLIEKAGTEK